MRVPELKSQRSCFGRHDPLTHQGPLASLRKTIEHERWDAKKRRAAEYAGQRVGELRVSDRFRGGEVDRPLDAMIIEGMENQVDPIVDVEPGHPLPAASQRGS